MNMNVRKTFYLVTLAAVVAVTVMGLLLVPNFNGSVSAQENADQNVAERASQEMIAWALNHKTELADRMALVNQLPCTTIADNELGGKTLEPGVYCLSSARLAGQLTLNGVDSKAGIFVIRTNELRVAANASIELTNGAQAANVFFVSDNATIGENAAFRANVWAKNEIKAENGARVSGKALSVNNKVTLDGAMADGGGTGSLEICKTIVAPVTGSPDISNRIFNFVVSGVAAGSPGSATNPLAVPVGSCSALIDVPVGPQTVTELNTGQTLTGGSFTGGFALNRVEVLTTQSGSTLGSVNLLTRVANVNIAEGNQPAQLTLRFVNQFAITGFVEICKNLGGADPDVTGIFTFNIEGQFTTNQANPTNQVLQNFFAPVGGCTGPIAVTIASPQPTGSPLESVVRVTELGRSDAFLESVEAFPAGREIGTEVLGQGVNAAGNTFTNPNGGFATVRVISGTSPANETLLNFVNRAVGIVKVCKIAGPGVPLNTIFRFTVTGTGVLDPTMAFPNPNPQFAAFGTVTRTVDVRAGSAASGGTCQIVGGFGASAPGFNQFQAFRSGSVVTVVENGISPLNDISQAGTIGQLRTSRVRVIGSVFATTGQAGFSPNPDLTPTETRVSRAAVIARREVVEVEFTNFRFNPAILKVCKIAGGTGATAVPVGTSFTFDVALVNPATGLANLPLFNFNQIGGAGTSAVTVTAGPASQGGFCTFLDGSLFPGGALNTNTPFTITERTTTPATTVTAIESSTTTLSGVNLAGRTATFSPVGSAVLTNIITFTNALTGTATPVAARAPFDFDGDNKTDMGVFRGSNNMWYVMQSNAGYSGIEFGTVNDGFASADYNGDNRADRATYRDGVWTIDYAGASRTTATLGQPGDIAVPADFDGDGKADIAVFRPSNGTWYVKQSTNGEIVETRFGQSGDRPVAADFDGDRKADIAVFRSGTWYLNRSRDGFLGVGFGTAGDRPVAADYDGDGKADIAVYRNGYWYSLDSSNGAFRAVHFGLSTDVVVPGDYDGDGRIDPAVFRNGTWHILQSTAGYKAENWGMSTDLPISAR